MSTVGNDTTGASDTGPASGYNMELSHLRHVISVLIQIKREHNQSLYYYNDDHFHSYQNLLYDF
jgi:hypothetical protein